MAALDKITDLSTDARERAFGSYLSELDTITREDQTNAPRTPIHTAGPPAEAEALPRTEGTTARDETLADRLVHLLGKRGGGSDTLDDALPSGTKRPRLAQADMPWFGQHTARKSIDLDFSYGRTCELLECYGEDLPRAKFLVRTAQNVPEGVISSQWERILKGEPLNLDHFLSAIVRTSIDEDRKARIGATQLSFSSNEPKRKIRTYGEWVSAWRRASRAISFAFPHRADELEDYFVHIQTLFDSRGATSHQRVILYDIAVRNFVGGGQSVLLTERERFSHLFAAVILSDGLEYAASPGTRKGTSAGSRSTTTTRADEVCNKFNTGTGCPHSPCKYRHTCKACGKEGHGRHECPDSR